MVWVLVWFTVSLLERFECWYNWRCLFWNGLKVGLIDDVPSGLVWMLVWFTMFLLVLSRKIMESTWSLACRVLCLLCSCTGQSFVWINRRSSGDYWAWCRLHQQVSVLKPSCLNLYPSISIFWNDVNINNVSQKQIDLGVQIRGQQGDVRAFRLILIVVCSPEGRLSLS